VGSVGQRERTHERVVTANRADPPDSEREWACKRGEVGADRLAPPGRGRERARVRERRLTLTGVVHLSADAGARVA
jgi:hypothetical protein